MKIAVTGTRGIPAIMGGVETHCEQLFPRIAAMGEDVTVIRRASYTGDGLTEWHGVKLLTLKAPRRKAFEAIIHTTKAVFAAKRMHADILHVHATGPALVVPLAKLLGMKVVFTHHGPDYQRDKWSPLAKRIIETGERFGCRYADDVIVISNVIREMVERKYGRTEGVHLIPNGVPQPQAARLPQYFRELEIEQGRFILAMGRFVPEKRLEDAVRAFSKAGLSSEGYRLVIAGDADFEDDYSRSLKAEALSGGVVLTGFVKGEKLHSLLGGAAAFLLPSSHEGLPIAMLEAMSYGLPVVASDIPANLEVGLGAESYFRLGDLDEFALKMASAVKRGEVQYDMSRYDWDSIARQTALVYKNK